MSTENIKTNQIITQPKQTQFNDDTVEIDLMELAYVLLDKIHYIALAFLLGAILLNAYAFFCIAPTYKSTAKLYVVSASSDSVVNLSDLNLGTSLASDYEELMLSYPVLDQVISKLDLDMTYTQLAETIALDNPSGTRILDITVTATDPELAKDIANTLAEVSADYLPETMSTISPNIAQVARAATNKSNPSYTKYTLIGAFAFALLLCVIFIAQFLLDDTIHTAADMEKYFGIVPLASIPDSDKFGMKDTMTFDGPNENEGRDA